MITIKDAVITYISYWDTRVVFYPNNKNWALLDEGESLSQNETNDFETRSEKK